MMKHVLDALREAGTPKDVPIMVTESHISWRLTGPMSTIFAALWLADNIGSFFEGGRRRVLSLADSAADRYRILAWGLRRGRTSLRTAITISLDTRRRIGPPV